jgi:acetoin utilization deacetylase AcuC-like enzyme
MTSEPGATPEPVVFIHHPSSLEHDTGMHPERAERIPAIERELEQRGWPGLRQVLAPEVEPEALRAVHPDEYVARIEALCAAGGGALDLDTVTSAGSYRAALHAAGGAMHMVDLLLGGDGAGVRAGFCALRPPGHHAEASRGMGFCLFNNVAVAARRARDAHGCQRVMVLDWDVHHGNGTNDIFWTDHGVLYVSIHQWPLYPGTGGPDDVGAEAGLGYTVNLPVPPGSGDETFVSLVEHLAVPLARAYEPRLFLVSAGFDAHRDDPLASCLVSDEGYAAMAGSVRRVCASLGDVPVGVVLEGGYALGALARSVAAVLDVLAASEAPSVQDVQLSPLSAEARVRVARFWPAVSDAGART